MLARKFDSDDAARPLPFEQAIKDWYNDPDYRPLIAKRHAVARSVMIAVEGQ